MKETGTRLEVAEATGQMNPESPQAYLNRELSWLAFARRVLALAEDPALPLLERVKFAGITGMLHDEFFMKRMGGLKRQQRDVPERASADGSRPAQGLIACREEIISQMKVLSRVIHGEILPGLAAAGCPIRRHADLDDGTRAHLAEYFQASILPILTPLAVDAAHPFPFISNQGLNLAIQVPEGDGGRYRFIRLKVPTNRDRWVPLPGGTGFVGLEEVIAANLDRLLPQSARMRTYLFRATRGAEGESPEAESQEMDPMLTPGSIVMQVTSELKARRFAGVVRLKVSHDMPEQLRTWLGQQLGVGPEDVYPTETFLGLADLAKLPANGRAELRDPPHRPVVHPRLRNLNGGTPASLFRELRNGDMLLHHPYHAFDTSVMQFLRAAATDPDVLAIKLTIYRTSSDSPIVNILAEAARRGKQVAVLVEITARFDEAPNIAWGRRLETEGVHVVYGVEKLKTHVKAALVVREEQGRIRNYAHLGTGNYHSGTARLYEDLGILTSDPEVCADVAALFNHLTGATPTPRYRKLIVAPGAMRTRFTEMIGREADHARAGRPSGIRAKMNQLQDGEIIRALYRASQAGVPIALNVRGLCCLRPGVPGLSEAIRVFSVVGRFLEHSRIYSFANGGNPEYYIGSADWMKRNLDRRVETLVGVTDPELQRQIAAILDTYDEDNRSAWDCGPDGTYVRRQPGPGEPVRAAQAMFIARAGSL